MKYLEPIDDNDTQLGQIYDEMPLWSAPLTLHLLDRLGTRERLLPALYRDTTA